MKYLRETLIIVAIYLVGELISKNFDLSIPGNILGMLILLALLIFNIIDLKAIENISKFLLDHLAFFFIPAGVGLMNSVHLIKESWIPFLIITITTTFLIIIITGKTVVYIQRLRERKKN